ncbi:YgiQ family radical SAM protein, partial [Candidatus Pacearchaeota archaeon CG10_big_fil_rev_8_21_14_0_10_35_13]
MEYDIIIITGEKYFDHPLCGVAIIKRILEKNGYKVGIIETPKTSGDVKNLGTPKLFFGITSGSIDSMLRNYTALKKPREENKKLKYTKEVQDRAVIVYSNWLKEHYKNTKIVLGGVEASLRRFAHYDYWDDKIRKPILQDTRADILVYGYGEKQILEIAKRIKNNEELKGIEGTSIRSRELPEGFLQLPSYEEVI